MRLIFLIAVIFFMGCHTNEKYPDGGYDYPTNVTGEDTNFYANPLKHLLPGKDSFQYANYSRLYHAFNEPNLSIRPLDKETFRLEYSPVLEKTILISLTQNQIIVKEGGIDMIYDFNDNSHHLTDIEECQLLFLQNHFPVDTTGKPVWKKRYLDSMITAYPQLLDPKYYLMLMDKKMPLRRKPLPYTVITIPIKREVYDSLVSQINASGYWSLPYEIPVNDNLLGFDGYSFQQEANTRKKYKIVSTPGYAGDTSKFTKACQELVRYAGMDKKISLVWKDSLIVQDITLEEEKPAKKKK